MEVDDDKGIVEAINGFADADEEPMPKRQRHAAFASSCQSLKQQLSPLATELAQAVRALVEADKKADEEEQGDEEEEEEVEAGAVVVAASLLAAEARGRRGRDFEERKGETSALFLCR